MSRGCYGWGTRGHFRIWSCDLIDGGGYGTYKHGSYGAVKVEADGGEEDDYTSFNDAISDSDGE